MMQILWCLGKYKQTGQKRGSSPCECNIYATNEGSLSNNKQAHLSNCSRILLKVNLRRLPGILAIGLIEIIKVEDSQEWTGCCMPRRQVRPMSQVFLHLFLTQQNAMTVSIKKDDRERYRNC